MKQNDCLEAILLIGSSGSGKTKTAYKYYGYAKEKRMHVGGIVCPGTFVNGQRFAFTVLDLLTGKQVALAERDMESAFQAGPFGFHAEGLAFGNQAIENAIQQHVELLILDEVGPYECQGNGWAYALKKVVAASIPQLLITIRPKVVDLVCSLFLENYSIRRIAVENAQQIGYQWNFETHL